jgi:hypothetical protein
MFPYTTMLVAFDYRGGKYMITSNFSHEVHDYVVLHGKGHDFAVFTYAQELLRMISLSVCMEMQYPVYV